MVHIFTDSCADLNPRLIDAHNISIIPLHVLVKDQDYLDNDLTLEELFSSVEETNELPKTAAPSVQEFITFFDTIDTKIYIGLSSELSATIQNAKLAANQLDDPNLFIIDSLNLSSGIGLLVLKAVDLRDAGLSVNDIVNEIESIKTKIRTAFVIDTMEYLYKGGRCTGLQAIFGSVLKIKPIIQVLSNGTLGVMDKIRGSRSKALQALLDRVKEDLPHINPRRVFVTHTGCRKDAEHLVKEVKKLAPFEDVLITEAGATIASHCGPNTIGILYLQK